MFFCPKQMRFHGSDGNSQDACDLVILLTLQVVERDNRPIFLGEGPDRRSQPVGFISGDRLALGAGSVIGSLRELVITITLAAG